MFLILPRLAIWLWDAGRESLCLLVTGFHSSPSAEQKSLLSDTAAHSHRQKYPANWMAYVRHSPQGTALRVSVCLQQKDRPWVNEKERKTDRKVSFFPFL